MASRPWSYSDDWRADATAICTLPYCGATSTTPDVAGRLRRFLTTSATATATAMSTTAATGTPIAMGSHENGAIFCALDEIRVLDAPVAKVVAVVTAALVAVAPTSLGSVNPAASVSVSVVKTGRLVSAAVLV